MENVVGGRVAMVVGGLFCLDYVHPWNFFCACEEKKGKNTILRTNLLKAT